MNENTFFFDTYAFFELARGNPNYKKYIYSRIVTAKGNLSELYYHNLRENGKESAQFVLTKYYPYTVDIDKEIISAAASFRLANKKKRLSMVDCVGYVLALAYGIKFLTGDKEFEGMPNIEFVK